ncbi:uncharacterized protein EI90DRAFT_3137116 [Cantharellus anzutake]|uniref:uncharacterized protein n=1 Tax=Cantharellus anzutake TaxID=1750568 RepID=UPI001904C262|nr:uncharacterized protein EI90DRAFT_3137116 [Cantharellus anzutake]KAF8312768.1 hypothetical protein EI90DRAFT_3137116 [Cantharellus anzutake]
MHSPQFSKVMWPVDNACKVIIVILGVSPAISSLVDDIRNEIDLTGSDDWSVSLNEPTIDYSLDMTCEELADVVTLLQPKQIQASQAHWAALIPSLSDIYLRYKTSNPCCMLLHYPEPPENSNFVHIYVIDVFDGWSYEHIPQDPDETSPTSAILHSGYIPPTPINPTVAISICSLELLHCLMCASSGFSVQSFARLLADLHHVSLAFDAYYAIITRGLMSYKLHDEPEHPINLIVTGDGNTSLSRLPHRSESDPRTFLSDYYLPRSEVDMFQNTKKQSQLPSMLAGPDDPPPESCVGWKNSRPMPQMMKAGSLSVMDETGIFLVICHHGIVQFIMDMVKSGELAKYPVAAANKLLSTFGSNILFAYDVGCTFSITLSRSAMLHLGPISRFKEGAGIEDGEGNERAFSSSNGIAAVTHHASAYYHHFQIHLHFEKWDQDKYERLGNFLLGNHTSAWTQIHESMAILDTTKHMHPTFDSDWDCPLFLQQEKEYIMSLKSEPKAKQAKIEYLDALEQLESTEMELWPLLLTLSISPTSELAYQALCVQRKVEEARCIVSALEATSSLALPWHVDSPQCHEAIQLHSERRYHRLLDDLEHRAISHQFELEKMGLLKTEIILIFSMALHSTLEKYNSAAAALIPPKPSLTWDDITHPNFPSIVELLQGCDDIQSCEWAQEHFREATCAWIKLQCAKEELVIIGIDARRILTAIRDEELQVKETIEAVTASNPVIASYISMTFKWRIQANAHLHKKLSSLEHRPNYLSPCGPGTSICFETSDSDTGQEPNVEPDAPPEIEMADVQQPDDGDPMNDGLLEEEDEAQSQLAIDKLVDLFNNSVIM